ncbi:MAG: bifunctional phosphopantothenoylcysteine decarboxylase/phosphopantothenate--cysteine ligase CoaBC [Lentisphaeria bacterium]|nr:bifunctional phosphopantothenoylcysteine decarboxylase/phosphopantothenate--cysteine ligase CoaBC [Lentisphaeria bacterium]
METQKTILITAGPTREKIDAVRFITNRSTGKMGYALAKAAVNQNFRVILISGVTNLPKVDGTEFIQIESAAEMAEVVKKYADSADFIIMSAAVADYRPKFVHANKMKKTDGDLTLILERTEDILKYLGENKKPNQLLIGFAAETDDLIANAKGKLERKNLDYIIANDVSKSDRGFGSDNNAVTILKRDGSREDINLLDKSALAEILITKICGN